MHKLEFSNFVEYDATAQGIELEVLVSFGKSSIRTRASLDTGAEFSVFQPDIAEALEIDYRTGRRLEFATAMNSSFTAFGHTLNIACCDVEFEATLYFADVIGFRRSVLGRTGWLDRLRIGLVHHDNKFYVDGYNNGAF
ncbi:MAG TPA: hypothetical protein VGC07_03810 [Granulicella sp.]